MQELQKKFPRAASAPLVNDESDPEKGWWRAEDWRAGVEYAVLMARNILNHKADPPCAIKSASFHILRKCCPRQLCLRAEWRV